MTHLNVGSYMCQLVCSQMLVDILSSQMERQRSRKEGESRLCRRYTDRQNDKLNSNV